MMNFWYTTSQSRRKNRTSIPGRKVLPVPQWALRCRRDFSPWRTMCWTTPYIQANEGDEEIGHEYAYLFWNMPDGMYRVDGKYGQYCIVMRNWDMSSPLRRNGIFPKRQSGLAGSVDFCYPSAFGICLNVLFFLWLQRKEKKA